eukprot:343639_1
MKEVTNFYKVAGFNEDIRVVFVGQKTITDADPVENFRMNTKIADYSGMGDLLDEFGKWGDAYTKFPDHDIVFLFSGKVFDHSATGVALLGDMLEPGAYALACVLDIGTETTLYAKTVAHELGHTMTLVHDDGAGCEVMCSYRKVPNPLKPFSDTTIARMNTCLKDNDDKWKKPAIIATSTCGNGIVEYDEECDCAREDCIGFDNCCDGRTCMMTRYTCPTVTDMSQLSPVFPIIVAVITALLFAGVLYESGSFRALKKNTIRVMKYPYRQQKKFRRNLKNVGRGRAVAERKEDY